MFDTEIQMLLSSMPDISKKVLNGETINIIDIGCGDGKKAVPVINHLNDLAEIRYCPIDISSYMVSRAIDKIKALNKGEVVQFRWNISDFDNLENVSSLLRDKQFRQNFFLFLGSTIGNFELHEVMYEIMEAMDEEEDYLLMGVALSNAKPEDVVKSYHSELVDNFLSKVLTQVGFKKEDIELNVRYENSRIEVMYDIKRDTCLKFGEQSLNFFRGDKILVAVSYRYNEQDLKKIMKFYFKDTKFYINKDKTWCLVLCHK
jgi:uncharacterized SAM-dependent methyltransferase